MSGSRTVPTALLAHMKSGATTLTLLLKVVSPFAGYAPFGICNLDRDIVYDDGAGAITYAAQIGMVPASMESQSSMEVGNSEFQHLIPQFNATVNEEDLRAGVYDYSTYTVYVVNYEDLTMGHWIPPAGFGQTGQVTVDNLGMSFKLELTDLAKLLKQSIVENYSLTCRAIFGSQPIGTGGGVIEQKFPCGFDASSIWSGSFTVTAQGAEASGSFTASALGLAANAVVPGMIQWLSGNNAGRQEMIAGQDGSGDIYLKFEMPFPIEVGDTFKVRVDCTKWKDGDLGCKAHFASVSATEWKLHYRGEPLIQVGDQNQDATPGATISTGPLG